MRMTLRVKRLPHCADLPDHQTEHAAGLDLHAAIDTAITLAPGAIELIPCGFVVEIPEGYEGQVRPRSGLALKHGISMPNAPGTIDADYRGEVKVPLINLGSAPFEVLPNMRIAQMVVAPIVQCDVVEVEDLGVTARAASGFGSTGA